MCGLLTWVWLHSIPMNCLQQTKKQERSFLFTYYELPILVCFLWNRDLKSIFYLLILMQNYLAFHFPWFGDIWELQFSILSWSVSAFQGLACFLCVEALMTIPWAYWFHLDAEEVIPTQLSLPSSPSGGSWRQKFSLLMAHQNALERWQGNT